ncbi:MAG: hypothetical protein ACREJ6_05965 [Candidatus Methylomirabilis sp.]
MTILYLACVVFVPGVELKGERMSIMDLLTADFTGLLSVLLWLAALWGVWRVLRFIGWRGILRAASLIVVVVLFLVVGLYPLWRALGIRMDWLLAWTRLVRHALAAVPSAAWLCVVGVSIASVLVAVLVDRRRRN